MKKKILLLVALFFIVHCTFNIDNCLSQVTQEWVAIYSGSGNSLDEATSIAVDASGNVYVTGRLRGSGTFIDYGTIKYNSSGVQQWIQIYNGPANGDDGANSLAIDASGNVYVTGGSVISGTYSDYATIKYNSAGVQQWIQTYNGPGNEEDGASSIAVDASGNVYVTGRSTGTSYPDWDYATIKYNSTGVQQWVQIYNRGSSDYGNKLAVDALGNVYVTGRSTGSGTNYDYVTIKYSQLVGIKPISNEISDAFRLEQNYPNPFNPVTKIKFDIPSGFPSTEGRPNGAYGNDRVVLKVFDITGKEITTLVNEQLQPGTYEVTFDGTGIPSGVYFYKLKSENYIDTKKMLLIK